MEARKDDLGKAPAMFQYYHALSILREGINSEEIDRVSLLMEVLSRRDLVLIDLRKQVTALIGLLKHAGLRWEDVARCCEHGAHKYGFQNYSHGLQYSRLINAYMRHDMKMHEDGEEIDLESGIPHIAHKAANLLILLESCYMRTGSNDIPLQLQEKTVSSFSICQDEGEQEAKTRGPLPSWDNLSSEEILHAAQTTSEFAHEFTKFLRSKPCKHLNPEYEDALKRFAKLGVE